MFILLLIILVYSDELVYTDYESDTEYDWSALQAGNPYSIESGDDIIKFTIGDDLSETCQGQKASVIRFSKAGDSCEILGRHQITFLSPFKKNYSSGIGVFYEGGSLCRDQLWGDIKRRTEFRLMCSKKESDFIFVNILSDCTTVLEKYSSVGCSKEVKYSPWVKILFFTFYGILFMLLVWLCIESFTEDTTIVSPENEWGVKKFFTGNKILTRNKEYYEV